jgi:hypothetical protein
MVRLEGLVGRGFVLGCVMLCSSADLRVWFRGGWIKLIIKLRRPRRRRKRGFRIGGSESTNHFMSLTSLDSKLGVGVRVCC